MEKGYTIKSTFESKDEDTIKKFLENKSETPKIGGKGLEGMLKDLIHGLDQKSARLDNPFTVLNDEDFDINPTVKLRIDKKWVNSKMGKKGFEGKEEF
jgi:hypothetical protein